MIKKRRNITRFILHGARQHVLPRPRFTQGLLIFVTLTMVISTIFVVLNGRMWWLFSLREIPPPSDSSGILAIKITSSRQLSDTITLNPPMLSPINPKTPVLSIQHQLLARSPEQPVVIHASSPLATTNRLLELVSYAINLSVPLPTRPVDVNGTLLPVSLVNVTISYVVRVHDLASSTAGSNPKLIEILNQTEVFTSANTPITKTGSVTWEVPTDDQLVAFQDRDVSHEYSLFWSLRMTLKNETTGQERVESIEVQYYPSQGLTFVIRHWTVLPEVGMLTLGTGLAALSAWGLFMYRKRMLQMT